VPVITGFRISNYDTPFWVSPNRRDGRYNRAGEGETQYVCLHPLGCWAEYMRGQEIRTPEAAEFFRSRIWAVEADIGAAEEITFDNAANYGLQPDDLIADDVGGCQAFGGRARADESISDVLLVPSAALPGTRNLVIFGPRLMSPYLVRPIDPAIDTPAAVAADFAVPPVFLIPFVRYYGDRHDELEAWRSGGLYEFRGPAAYPTP
jgi:RES domain-containing protein